MWSIGKLAGLLASSGLLFLGPVSAAPAASSSSATAAATTVAVAAAAAGGPTVTIASGVVVGKTTTATSGLSSTGTAVNYLSVPFAAVPTGSLRFAPPVTASSWSKPLMATSLPPACRQQFIGGPQISENIQKSFNNPGHTRPQESEDCLYLNIFAPTDASSKNLKPVLFWIFGGNLEFGTGSLNYYNGSSFAAFQDVMVVTINYRTNIFGFSGSPELPQGQQNVGYLDQRMALKWVQSNIAAFGGDPKRVTIFGESAGAYSVKQLLAQPPSPLPFSAAILESTAASVGAGAPDYALVVAAFNCTTAPSQLNCLRKVDGLQLEQFISNNSLLFYPNADNVTQTFDVRPSILSKKFAKVPIMLGHNAEEGRIFAALVGGDPGNTTVQQAIAKIFPNNSTLQSAVLAAYNTPTESAYEIASQVLTDLIFGCTASSLSTFAASNGYDVWRYYYNATFPNLQLFPNLGAFHTSEIPQVWGTYDRRNDIGAVTANQIALSKYMQTTWANFAKNPSRGPAWPKLTFNALTNQIGELGGRSATGETTINANDVDYQCPLFDAVIALEGY